MDPILVLGLGDSARSVLDALQCQLRSDQRLCDLQAGKNPSRRRWERESRRQWDWPVQLEHLGNDYLGQRWHDAEVLLNEHVRWSTQQVRDQPLTVLVITLLEDALGCGAVPMVARALLQASCAHVSEGRPTLLGFVLAPDQTDVTRLLRSLRSSTATGVEYESALRELDQGLSVPAPPGGPAYVPGAAVADAPLLDWCYLVGTADGAPSETVHRAAAAALLGHILSDPRRELERYRAGGGPPSRSIVLKRWAGLSASLGSTAAAAQIDQFAAQVLERFVAQVTEPDAEFKPSRDVARLSRLDGLPPIVSGVFNGRLRGSLAAGGIAPEELRPATDIDLPPLPEPPDLRDEEEPFSAPRAVEKADTLIASYLGDLGCEAQNRVEPTLLDVLRRWTVRAGNEWAEALGQVMADVVNEQTQRAGIDRARKLAHELGEMIHEIDKADGYLEVAKDRLVDRVNYVRREALREEGGSRRRKLLLEMLQLSQERAVYCCICRLLRIMSDQVDRAGPAALDRMKDDPLGTAVSQAQREVPWPALFPGADPCRPGGAGSSDDGKKRLLGACLVRYGLPLDSMDEVSNRVLADRCRWVASLCAVDGELALDGLRLVAIARSPGGDEPELGAADLSHLARGPFLYLAQLSAPQALREAGVDPAAAVQCLIRDCLGTGLLHGNGQPEQQSDQFVPRHTWVFGTWSDLQGSTLDRIEEDARAVHAHLVAWNTADAAAEPLAQVLSKDPGESPYPTADKILCVSLVRLS